MTPTPTPIMNTIMRALTTILLLAGCPYVAHAQSYTPAPPPFQTALNNSGAIINNACIWTYVAGTTTAATTYSDSSGTTNTNPIRSDSAGRFTVYLIAGSNYKFQYESSCTPPSHGTILRTADNIPGVPSSAASVDITGTAGETITAGQCVYLSDGSGSKVAGQWYRCDIANPYSSSIAIALGLAPASIASGSSGTVRLQGQVTGLTSLTVSTPYYVGATGALTATAGPRLVGIADSTTSLILPPPNAPAVENGIDDFRLTLTTGVPVTTSDVTAATTLFCAPFHGNRIALYDSTGAATVYTSAQFSIAVPATTSQMYDVFAFSSSGVPTLELLAWTNDTTRATALVLTTTGTYTKTGDLTRRYLGSFRTTTVSGQTEDSLSKRYLWNYYNRVRRQMLVVDATASWAYTTNTLRQARATATNQLDLVIGISEDIVQANVIGNAADTTSGSFMVGIGLDSTSVIATGVTAGIASWSVSGAIYAPTASASIYPGVGRHTLVWLEAVASGTATTWFGKDKFQTGISSGISGFVDG